MTVQFCFFFLTNVVFIPCWFSRNQSQEDLISARSNDGFKITDVQQDNAYAVFVTYIEIYNDNVFDLLENINETDVYTK